MPGFPRPSPRITVWLIRIAAALAVAPAQSAQCPPSPDTGPGGHYVKPGNTGGQLGSGLVIHGLVVGSVDCRPLAGAVIESWQAGNDGRYHDRLRTVMKTDRKGRFTLHTEWPNDKPSHIHFHVVVPGYNRLVTAWQFERPVPRADVRLVLIPLAGRR